MEIHRVFPIYCTLVSDDSLVFCGPKTEQVWHLTSILMWFEIVSELQSKSEKERDVLSQYISDFWCCKVGSFPVTYLGLPLGSSFKLKSVWKPVIERFEKRLSGWKRGYLSKGGKMNLIKSTLPIYYLYIFKIRSSVAKRLERNQQDFFMKMHVR